MIFAELFGKEHKNVIQSIENLVAENSAAKYFHKSSYENRGKQYPMYYMNRDGFSLLVMGFMESIRGLLTKAENSAVIKMVYVTLLIYHVDPNLESPILDRPPTSTHKTVRNTGCLK